MKGILNKSFNWFDFITFWSWRLLVLNVCMAPTIFILHIRRKTHILLLSATHMSPSCTPSLLDLISLHKLWVNYEQCSADAFFSTISITKFILIFLAKSIEVVYVMKLTWSNRWRHFYNSIGNCGLLKLFLLKRFLN